MIERIESLVRRNAQILSHKDGNPGTHTPVSTDPKKQSNNLISYPFQKLRFSDFIRVTSRQLDSRSVPW